ncbi:MAG: hypothetical protein JXR76_04035 [Deltaproteobacteria bacterium]|nr:hypothetical protein [Deltaproteobacteria bacterium]
MASKATIYRQRSSERVIAACTTHANKIQLALGHIYTPDMGVASSILINGLTASLSECTRRMIEADTANEAELQDDDGVRRNRDEAAEKLYSQLTTTRDQVTIICGPEFVAELGFRGDTPRDPVALTRLAEVVQHKLNTTLAPVPLIPGYVFDANIWKKPLTEYLIALKEALYSEANESREAEATLLAKREAISRYDQEFSRTANLVSTLLEISGEAELARRVRPSFQQPGQTSEDASDSQPTTH